MTPPLPAITLHVPKLGRDVVLRPLENSPEDRQRVRTAYRALPESARMNRFWSNNASLSEKMIDHLLNADQLNHVVWAALDPTDPELPGIGAASYWRDLHNPSAAEFSITVGARFHRQGIGTLLLSLLWSIARRNNIESFFGHVRFDNRPALRWFGKIGVDSSLQSGDIRISWPLRSPEEIAALTAPPALLPQIADWQRQLAPRLESIL